MWRTIYELGQVLGKEGEVPSLRARKWKVHPREKQEEKCERCQAHALGGGGAAESDGSQSEQLLEEQAGPPAACLVPPRPLRRSAESTCSANIC